jgi:hypothetical protein
VEGEEGKERGGGSGEGRRGKREGRGVGRERRGKGVMTTDTFLSI